MPSASTRFRGLADHLYNGRNVLRAVHDAVQIVEEPDLQGVSAPGAGVPPAPTTSPNIP